MPAPLNTTLRPILIIALAGSIAAVTGCGPKRAGFWKKDTNTAHQTAGIDHSLARSNTYYTTKKTDIKPVTTPRLSSNSTASIEYAMAAETPSPASKGSMPTTQSKPAAQSVAQTNNPSSATPAASKPVNETVATTTSFQSQTRPNAQAPQTSTPIAKPTNQVAASDSESPYFTNESAAPSGLKSGDLSALIYANAMGAELPAESSTNGTHATLNVRQITRSYAGTDFDPVITPDGDHIIFASTQHRPTADLYIKSIDGTVVTRLTDDPAQDVMPSVSPDGQFIAFSSDRNGTWDLYVMPAEGGKVVQVTTESTHDLHPSWSPDGTKLVFSRLGEQTGRWEMWTLEINASSGAQFIGFGLFPEWCPVAGSGMFGADQILFQRSRERGDRAFGVWTMDYNAETGNAGRETEIANGPNQALINPTWSPDGKFICFAAVPNSESWANGTAAQPDSSTLWMVSTEGTGKVKLTDGRAIDLMPAWGRKNDIVFVSNMDGQEHLWSMELSPAVRAASVQIPDIKSTFATVPTEGEPNTGE